MLSRVKVHRILHLFSSAYYILWLLFLAVRKNSFSRGLSSSGTGCSGGVSVPGGILKICAGGTWIPGLVRGLAEQGELDLFFPTSWTLWFLLIALNDTSVLSCKYGSIIYLHVLQWLISFSELKLLRAACRDLRVKQVFVGMFPSAITLAREILEKSQHKEISVFVGQFITTKQELSFWVN